MEPKRPRRQGDVRVGAASAEGHMGVHVQLYLYTHFGAENTSNGTRNGTRTAAEK